VRASSPETDAQTAALRVLTWASVFAEPDLRPEVYVGVMCEYRSSAIPTAECSSISETALGRIPGSSSSDAVVTRCANPGTTLGVTTPDSARRETRWPAREHETRAMS